MLASFSQNVPPKHEIGLSKSEATALRRAFEAFDINGSWTIDFSELQQIFKVLKLGHVTPEELARKFRQVDVDHSGEIDYNEFVRMYMDIKRQHTCTAEEAAEIMKKRPHDRSGEEVRRLANHLFQELPAFSQFSRQVLNELCRVLCFREVPEGQWLWRHGDPHDSCMYVLLDGWVSAWVKPVGTYDPASLRSPSGRGDGSKSGRHLGSSSSIHASLRQSVLSRAGSDEEDEGSGAGTPSTWGGLSRGTSFAHSSFARSSHGTSFARLTFSEEVGGGDPAAPGGERGPAQPEALKTRLGRLLGLARRKNDSSAGDSEGGAAPEADAQPVGSKSRKGKKVTVHWLARLQSAQAEQLSPMARLRRAVLIVIATQRVLRWHRASVEARAAGSPRNSPRGAASEAQRQGSGGGAGSGSDSASPGGASGPESSLHSSRTGSPLRTASSAAGPVKSDSGVSEVAARAARLMGARRQPSAAGGGAEGASGAGSQKSRRMWGKVSWAARLLGRSSSRSRLVKGDEATVKVVASTGEVPHLCSLEAVPADITNLLYEAQGVKGEAFVGCCTTGSWLGERALVTEGDDAHPCSILAMTPLKVAVLEREAFDQVLKEFGGPTAYAPDYLIRLAGLPPASRSETDTAKLVWYLGQVPAFAQLPRPLRAQLAGSLLPERFIQGEMVMRQGDVAHAMYILVAGNMGVFVKAGDLDELQALSLGNGYQLPSALEIPSPRLSTPGGTPSSSLAALLSPRGRTSNSGRMSSSGTPTAGSGFAAAAAASLSGRRAPPRARASLAGPAAFAAAAAAAAGGGGAKLQAGGRPASALLLQRTTSSLVSSGSRDAPASPRQRSSIASGGSPLRASSTQSPIAAVVHKISSLAVPAHAVAVSLALAPQPANISATHNDRRMALANNRASQATAAAIRAKQARAGAGDDKLITTQHVDSASKVAVLFEGSTGDSVNLDSMDRVQQESVKQLETQIQELEATFGTLQQQLGPGKAAGEVELMNMQDASDSGPAYKIRRRNASAVALEALMVFKIEQQVYRSVLQEFRKQELAGRLAFLQGIALFSGLRSAPLMVIDNSLQWLHVQRGAVLQHLGTPLHGIVLIKTGQVGLYQLPARNATITQIKRSVRAKADAQLAAEAEADGAKGGAPEPPSLLARRTSTSGAASVVSSVPPARKSFSGAAGPGTPGSPHLMRPNMSGFSPGKGFRGGASDLLHSPKLGGARAAGVLPSPSAAAAGGNPAAKRSYDGAWAGGSSAAAGGSSSSMQGLHALRRVALLGPNDYFGEDALMSGGVHQVTAIAETECRLAWLRPSDMATLDRAGLGALMRYCQLRGSWRRKQGQRGPDEWSGIIAEPEPGDPTARAAAAKKAQAAAAGPGAASGGAGGNASGAPSSSSATAAAVAAIAASANKPRGRSGGTGAAADGGRGERGGGGGGAAGSGSGGRGKKWKVERILQDQRETVKIDPAIYHTWMLAAAKDTRIKALREMLEAAAAAGDADAAAAAAHALDSGAADTAVAQRLHQRLHGSSGGGAAGAGGGAGGSAQQGPAAAGSGTTARSPRTGASDTAGAADGGEGAAAGGGISSGGAGRAGMVMGLRRAPHDGVLTHHHHLNQEELHPLPHTAQLQAQALLQPPPLPPLPEQQQQQQQQAAGLEAASDHHHHQFPHQHGETHPSSSTGQAVHVPTSSTPGPAVQAVHAGGTNNGEDAYAHFLGADGASSIDVGMDAAAAEGAAPHGHGHVLAADAWPQGTGDAAPLHGSSPGGVNYQQQHYQQQRRSPRLGSSPRSPTGRKQLTSSTFHKPPHMMSSTSCMELADNMFFPSFRSAVVAAPDADDRDVTRGAAAVRAATTGSARTASATGAFPGRATASGSSNNSTEAGERGAAAAAAAEAATRTRRMLKNLMAGARPRSALPVTAAPTAATTWGTAHSAITMLHKLSGLIPDSSNGASGGGDGANGAAVGSPRGGAWGEHRHGSAATMHGPAAGVTGRSCELGDPAVVVRPLSPRRTTGGSPEHQRHQALLQALDAGGGAPPVHPPLDVTSPMLHHVYREPPYPGSMVGGHHYSAADVTSFRYVGNATAAPPAAGVASHPHGGEAGVASSRAPDQATFMNRSQVLDLAIQRDLPHVVAAAEAALRRDPGS